MESDYSDPWYRFRRVVSILERYLSLKGRTVLDIGCNQGQFLELLENEYGVLATGIDQWDPALKGSGRWRYVKGDLANDINLEDKFDIVSALEVIEHVIDTDRFLQDCHDHLKDDGFLVITTPNINSLRNRARVPLGKYPCGLEYRNVIHHVRLYNVSCLRTHLEEHGFHVVTVSGVNAIPNRFLRFKALRTVSEVFSERFPELCGNIIAVAKKVERPRERAK
jgi:2-polyprenyl-3-methyl-5-hydroxy-6-metoxy-1,4-benzoquinol methylase